MSIDLLSSPTVLRRELKRLIETAERIDLFVPSLSDPLLTRQLLAAVERGAEVNLTTNLDLDTDPDALATLRDAGAFVGDFAPARHGRRTVEKYAPGVMIFDSESEWWTAAIVGSFTATEAALARGLGAATLLQSSTFDGTDPAGETICDVLNWGDSINHRPLDDERLAALRELHAPATAPEPEPEPAPAPPPAPAAQIVEPKPIPRFISPLSWQELRSCDWGTYWKGLLDADEQDRGRGAVKLCAGKGWLFGISSAHAAFKSGPTTWREDDIQAELLGRTRPSRVLGRIGKGAFATLIDENPGFRFALHTAVERAIPADTANEVFEALAPLVAQYDLPIPELTRFLAIAAPDRFFSILDETAQLRLSDIVGFDLTDRDGDAILHLRRYLDAVELSRTYPWAAELSAERTSDHPLEADAWSQRVALLGCLVG